MKRPLKGNDIVKRLLDSSSKIKDERKKSGSKARKKRKREEEDEKPPPTEEELIDLQVKSMLKLDRMLSGESNATKSLRKTVVEQNTQANRRRRADKEACGRTASAQAHAAHPPTFNKRKHAKEKKEKSLRKIAMLLAKNKKK